VIDGTQEKWRGIVTDLAKAGCKVAVWDNLTGPVWEGSNGEAFLKALESMTNIRLYDVDLNNSRDVKIAYMRTVDELGMPDILVNQIPRILEKMVVG